MPIVMERAGETTVDLEDRESVPGGRRVPKLTWVFPQAAQGGSLLLEHGTTLGRADTCNIRVDGDGISRQHLELTREGPALVARDSGSTNGTFVDGRRIQQARLRDGSVLRVGNWVGIVSWVAATEADAGFSQIANGLWGSEVLRQAIEPGRRAAPSRLPVLLVGETGTGKEVCARAIHEWSARPGSFMALNCAALPKELAEAELFGHARGAFTGAVHDSAGYFRSAHHGTLLLDEVNELPLQTQAKLLRVLQERAVTPLGRAEPVAVDVRTICASQVPLARAVAAGTFRSDLFMRLNGVQIELPPLRVRRVDVPRLFQTFLASGASTPPGVQARLIEALCLYPWPGNVRELQLAAQRLLALFSNEPVLKPEHLPPDLRAEVKGEGEDTPPSPEDDRGRDELGRLAAKLRQNGANLSRACADLGISRQRAYRLLAGRSVQQLVTELGADLDG